MLVKLQFDDYDDNLTLMAAHKTNDTGGKKLTNSSERANAARRLIEKSSLKKLSDAEGRCNAILGVLNAHSDFLSNLSVENPPAPNLYERIIHQPAITYNRSCAVRSGSSHLALCYVQRETDSNMQTRSNILDVLVKCYYADEGIAIWLPEVFWNDLDRVATVAPDASGELLSRFFGERQVKTLGLQIDRTKSTVEIGDSVRIPGTVLTADSTKRWGASYTFSSNELALTFLDRVLFSYRPIISNEYAPRTSRHLKTDKSFQFFDACSLDEAPLYS